VGADIKISSFVVNVNKEVIGENVKICDYI
jgi:hypothetical protein